ncbi:TetR/AcrR family transcriptional regulator [Acetobacterium woodii]|uniref:Transcriptional regulator TetR family n=1 Tax=Acetobacterium woodii (strain ATCC 29683 / DSM 1030 / JCM 2381 / KCTC 1655 / WB1) TaxID=931626 RepID=H6LBW5_ACEWD|nr:TetR/AcrR family transcriptional regulator [Acetobacterium woodii]AFA47708.1 transcriptional regulator TetR family [Acetobacterium woodii DSM 1030]
MRKMTKGELTKERIFLSAKELFYNQGYNATTIQQIADHSATTLGSMTYHFATKDTFIAKIFEDYLNSITKSLREKLVGYKPINSFENHFYLTMVWYNYLLTDPNVNNFYHEISQNESLYPFLHLRMSDIYHGFVRDFNLRIRAIEFDALLIADFGARRDLTRAFCEKKIKMPVEDFSILIITNTARCFGIPEKSIYRVSYEALLFFRNHDFSEIKLLI